MGRITFIEHDGTEHVVEIEAGKSLMETATENGVPGIDADCGGACACGTCHVMVEASWLPATGAMLASEESMLSMTPEKTDTSRLACQVTISEAMDGMVVRLPEYQM